ncbi:hypothetical protein A9Q99_02090 [Gammaproteobacteria bacterium 45_16_T64]|nr:hypothetical protein A9Q99_02090 [Gammaproteobacteria bacterium 45_16_T64]
MADLNILDFYKDTAKVLIQLHRHFPRRSDVYVEDLIGADHTDEFGLHSKRHESCFAAILWLSEENYIRFQSTSRQEAINQATLTSRALILLSTSDYPASTKKPTEITKIDTRIEQLRDAIKSESSEQLASTMRYFFEK